MGTEHLAGTNSRRYRDGVVRLLWAGPWRGLPCYHCGHAIAAGLGTVQHLLSPAVAPALAWEPSNLRPCHGSGKRRCPACGLSCQQVAASNVAPRDERGRPLPWDEAFIRQAPGADRKEPPGAVSAGNASPAEGAAGTGGGLRGRGAALVNAGDTRRVLDLIARGLRDDEAARELGISGAAWRARKAAVLRARRRLPRADR